MGRAKKNWIKDAISKPGALHEELHVPMGQKIPKRRLMKAARSKNPILKKRAVLAETLSKLRKK